MLRRLHGPRPGPNNPDQLLLFTNTDNGMSPADASAPPEAPPTDQDTKPSRRGKSKPHGRRRPSANLRREEKRYELTAAERACPDCGQKRQLIGVETTEQ